jgi:prepilin-type N-terminal cleavage/methylation domain-containing protein
MTLLEVVVALAVLGIGVVATQRLLVDSTRSLADERELTRAMLGARSLLADAALHPPPVGHTTGVVPGGGALRYERTVSPTPHPALRRVEVRVGSLRGPPCELVELIRVPSH